MTNRLSLTSDLVFKLLFGDPAYSDVLIALLTAVLQPSTPIQTVRVLNPEPPKFDQIEKGIVLDVLIEFADGTQVDVEMQATRRPAFRPRLLYYWARPYLAQLNRGEQYDMLRPVVVVVFIDYLENPSKRIHSVFDVRERHDGSQFDDKLEIHLVELPKLGRQGTMPINEDLQRWIRLFRANTNEEIQQLAKEDPMIAKTVQMLDKLSASPDVRHWVERAEEAQKFHQIDLKMAKAEGLAEGKAEAVLSVLRARGLDIGEQVQNQILACNDLEKLNQWLVRAVTVERAEDLLGS